MRKLTTILCTFCLLTVLTVPALAAMRPIHFAVPPWPGAMMKATIASMILNAAGYPTKVVEMGVSDIYMGLENGTVDVYMSAWLPTQSTLLQPLIDKKRVRVAGTNVTGAKVGLCVPGYAHAAGVTSVSDLAAHKDKFDGTIQNIESGSGMYVVVTKFINEDIAGLGTWQQQGQSIDAMLAAVQKDFDAKKWVVFGCWKPHWMNLTLDLFYLEGTKQTKLLIATNEIATILGDALKTTYPDAFMFLSRFHVNTDTQGKWTYDVSFKKQPVNEAARSWITGNIEVIRQWLGNLKAADGKTKAVDALEGQF
ncbi:MAG: glycine/betaine ABC transporter substrate-binding protein [Desulfovibrionales bacterium]|nr:glycine/betaine ABC transporter substrate-binding protein [Desulfovibrionales bacterium]